MRKFAIVMFILVLVVAVEAICIATIGYNGSPWLPGYWLLRLGEPLFEYPHSSIVLMAVLVGAYAASEWGRSASLGVGAAAWFVALIAAATPRGETGPGAPEYLVPTILFGIVSVAVLAHSGYTILRRR